MTESSKEAVALELLKIIAAVDGKKLAPSSADDENSPGQQWVFKTYAKCMDVVNNPQNYEPVESVAKPVPTT